MFEVMKKGSVQLQKTDAAIEHYRKEYELPVRSRLRSGQQAGKEKLEE